uniref:Uncharacterized protein n=1 Tax=Rhizophora mucronata TaxID=61149 RepID=A0A2P2NYL8_RHIMU
MMHMSKQAKIKKLSKAAQIEPTQQTQSRSINEIRY